MIALAIRNGITSDVPPALTLPAFPQHGLSDSANRIDELWSQLNTYEETITIGDRQKRLLKLLADALVEWVDRNSDEATHDPRSLTYAERFAQLLPLDVPLPDVYCDAHGDFTFEWDLGRRAIFAASVGRDGSISYSGLYGTTAQHGDENLGLAIPRAVVEGIRRLAKVAPDYRG